MNRRGFLKASLAAGVATPFIKFDSLMGLYVPKDDFLIGQPELWGVDFSIGARDGAKGVAFIDKQLKHAAQMLSRNLGLDISTDQLRVMKQYNIDWDETTYRADVLVSNHTLLPIDCSVTSAHIVQNGVVA